MKSEKSEGCAIIGMIVLDAVIHKIIDVLYDNRQNIYEYVLRIGNNILGRARADNNQEVELAEILIRNENGNFRNFISEINEPSKKYRVCEKDKKCEIKNLQST